MKEVNKPFLDTLRDRFVSQKDAKMFGLKIDPDSVAPKDTQIFVLSPEVSLAAHKLTRSPSFKSQPISEMRFPYPNIAIEIPFTQEVRNLREPDDPTLVGKIFPIARIGALIQQSSDFKVVLVTPYWEFEDPSLTQPPVFSFMFCSEGEPPPPRAEIAMKNERVRASVFPSHGLIGMIEKSPVDKFATIRALYEEPDSKKFIEEAASEVPTLLFACSALLNCKSGIKQTKVAANTPPKGLKLGARKQRRMSSSPYTLLHLEEIEEVSSSGAISHKADIAAHYVRGHFKQKKKGVYWWNPFIRGKGELRRRTAYIVEE